MPLRGPDTYTYFFEFGAMLIALDPGGPELDGLLTPIGVGYDPGPTLAIDANFIPLYNGPLDRVNLATNKFSSHGSVDEKQNLVDLVIEACSPTKRFASNKLDWHESAAGATATMCTWLTSQDNFTVSVTFGFV